MYLFAIYLDGLSECLNKSSVGCLIGGRKINHIVYADDIVLISPSGKDLRTLLDICEEYAISHLIKFNTVKSKILIVRSPSYSKLTFPKFHLAGSDLEEVTEYKYLGHFITNNLSDNRDITRAVNSLYASGMGIT